MSQYCKMTLIWDLDETIIQTIDSAETEKLDAVRKVYPTLQIPGVTVHAITINNREYYMFVRPGFEMDSVWDFIFSAFNVGVLTAAKQKYAHEVVRNVMLQGGTASDRKLSFMYSRESYGEIIKHPVTVGKNTKTYSGHKNLNYMFDVLQPFGAYPCNSILIDDHKDAYETNKFNTIGVPAWNVVQQKEDKWVFNEACSKDKICVTLMKLLAYFDYEYKQNSCDADNNYTGCPAALTMPIIHTWSKKIYTSEAEEETEKVRAEAEANGEAFEEEEDWLDQLNISWND